MPIKYRVTAPQPGFLLNINSGDQFGRLTIVREVEGIQRFKNGAKNGFRRRFECKCQCGEVKIIILDGLRSGACKSCRCYGDTINTRHGMHKSPEYGAWEEILQRCGRTPKADAIPRYVEVGVCDEWVKDFVPFFEHIGLRPSPRHSIDRIDNDRGYFPGNVRWATPKIQSGNRRNTIWIDFNGERRRLMDVVDESVAECHNEIKPDTLRSRLLKGIRGADLFAPLRRGQTTK